MTWQPVAVVSAEIELVLTSFMRTQLASRQESYTRNVWVDREMPSAEIVAKTGLKPERYVIFRRDGGQEFGVFDQPRVSVRCYALKESDVSDLAALVNALLKRSVDGRPVIRCVRQSGPLPIAQDGPLFQRYSLHEFTTRGVALT